MAFLLLPFPPLFLAGPLAGRLLLSRPGTLREWSWIGLALALVGAAFALGPDSVAQQLVRAAGLVFTGALLALLGWRPGPPFRHAVLAAGFTAAAVAAGAAGAGIRWEAFRASVRGQLQDAVALFPGAARMPPEQVDELRAMLEWVSGLYPGIAALGAIAGGTLAVTVAGYVAVRAAGPPPARFGAFRFNDHLIWGALVTLALALAPITGPWADLVANLLVVWAGLYVARGAAVLVSVWIRWPMPLRVVLCMLGVVLLHFALGGLLLLGLADTWLDFRRRIPPPDSHGAAS